MQRRRFATYRQPKTILRMLNNIITIAPPTLRLVTCIQDLGNDIERFYFRLRDGNFTARGKFTRYRLHKTPLSYLITEHAQTIQEMESDPNTCMTLRAALSVLGPVPPDSEYSQHLFNVVHKFKSIKAAKNWLDGKQRKLKNRKLLYQSWRDEALGLVRLGLEYNLRLSTAGGIIDDLGDGARRINRTSLAFVLVHFSQLIRCHDYRFNFLLRRIEMISIRHQRLLEKTLADTAVAWSSVAGHLGFVFVHLEVNYHSNEVVVKSAIRRSKGDRSTHATFRFTGTDGEPYVQCWPYRGLSERWTASYDGVKVEGYNNE